YDQMYAQIGEQTLEQLIARVLIEQEAERKQVQVSEEDIDAEIAELAEQYGGEENFQQLLQQTGGSLELLREDVRLNLLVERLLAPEIQISEDDMRAYYEENKEAFQQQEQVRARHILVEDSALARELLVQLRNGASFEELAKEHSIDQASAEQGGDLGWFGRGVMVKAFEDAAFSAEVGALVGPVQTEHGYHIIEVLEHKPARQQTFEEVKDQVRDILFQRQLQEKLGPWLEQLRAEADIQRSVTQ
ncbi:MAG TPA: peptidylprolyl isomerase, partial [Bacillota bacterium]